MAGRRRADRGSRAGSVPFVLQTLGLTYALGAVALTLLVVVPGLTMGWQAHVVLTGSMAPEIVPGSVVLTEPPDADVAIEPGQVITFDPPGQEGTVTHRVIEVETTDDGEVVGYRTKGDANASADGGLVIPEGIVGVGRFQVPLVGLPVMWASHEQWVPLIAWLAASGVLFWMATQVFARRPRQPALPPLPTPPPAAPAVAPAAAPSQAAPPAAAPSRQVPRQLPRLPRPPRPPRPPAPAGH